MSQYEIDLKKQFFFHLIKFSLDFIWNIMRQNGELIDYEYNMQFNSL